MFDLGGIRFNRSWCAAGALNYHGWGWWYHRWFGPFKPDFSGATLVTKTVTAYPHAGNMPLTISGDSKRPYPDCIRVNIRRVAVLNAVGLSNPGIEAVLMTGAWQTRLDPLVISFSTTVPSADDNKTFRGTQKEWENREASNFSYALSLVRDRFVSPFAVEINLSCPNLTHAQTLDTDAVERVVSPFQKELPGVPLILKFNLLVPTEQALELSEIDGVSAITCSNTVPWGQCKQVIDWRGLFGEISPLAKYGGGGLSGAPLTQLVWDWTRRYQLLKPRKPQIASGGVCLPDHALRLLDLGVGAVEIGSVAMVRPWRVGSIIRAIRAWDMEHSTP